MTTKMWGNGHFMPHRVVRSPCEVSEVTFDYIVCANKVTSSDGLSFIQDLVPAVSANTALVSAQNGVGVEAPLRQAFPNNTILSAVCYVSCVQPMAGIIQQVSNLRPNALHVGTYDPRQGEDAAADKVNLEEFVGLDEKFIQVSDAQAERWTKQIFNGAWNPMTAISGLETHPLLGSPYLETVRQLANEIFLVAVRLGIALADDLPAKTIEFARDNPSLAPSMLQDARKKRPMEVESLCGKYYLKRWCNRSFLTAMPGNICRQADQIGVPVPTVKLVYHTLLEMNRRLLVPTQPLPSRKEHVLTHNRSRSVPQNLGVPIAIKAAAN